MSFDRRRSMAVDAAGFSWSSQELFVDTVEKSAAVTGFREAIIAAREAALAREGRALAIEELLAMSESADVLPSRHEFKESDYHEFLDKMRAFNRETGLNVRLNFASSFCVTFVCPDRVGVLARLTRR